MKPDDSRITTIEVLYFARLREAFGCDRERVSIPESVRNVADLTAWLKQRGAAWAHELAQGKPVLIAVNEDMAGADTPIRSGDTVALMPPVTGG
ncbi:MAG TPA: molybdopterin converting factor subunit 1 [Burkholderiales bacterium]|nr:molybdopterin converting factor subunit 1 [Burkholderiales bacterium]